jgi:hypothetical protein
VENNNIKNWVSSNLLYSRGVICKKCNESWFIKNGFEKEFQKILSTTSFLEKNSTTIPQRIWHIINDIPCKIKCNNPSCLNSPTFFSFNRGYLRTCCPTCAQFDPQTIEKIQKTNLRKYGSEYGLSNRDIIKKRKLTLQQKYGVDNVSKLKEISIKKIKTCKKNYGTDWFLSRTDIVKEKVREKYGVDNVLKIPTVQNSVSKTKKLDFYNFILYSDKFKSLTPLFTQEEYKGCGVDHKFLCKNCNTEFFGKIEDGNIPRCIVCYPKQQNSIFQKEIFYYLKSIIPDKLEIVENTKKILPSGKELDIYFPSLKLAIECDGLYWHSEVSGEKSKQYHLNKTTECEIMGIRLIHIFEDEWIEKTTIVKSKLSNLLKVEKLNKIYARKCEVRVVNKPVKKEFLNTYHIQGNDNSSLYLGLFYNSELVSIMSFNKLRVCFNNKNADHDGVFELVRFATSTSVIGAGSKLLSHFIKTHHPKKIISYADKRWSTGNLYRTIGFKKISEGTPNYWYFGRGNSYKRHHRFAFAKHTLSKKLKFFDPNLSEWENMKLNGWDRIWDCGSLKYQLTFD